MILRVLHSVFRYGDFMEIFHRTLFPTITTFSMDTCFCIKQPKITVGHIGGQHKLLCKKKSKAPVDRPIRIVKHTYGRVVWSPFVLLLLSRSSISVAGVRNDPDDVINDCRTKRESHSTTKGLPWFPCGRAEFSPGKEKYIIHLRWRRKFQPAMLSSLF